MKLRHMITFLAPANGLASALAVPVPEPNIEAVAKRSEDVVERSAEASRPTKRHRSSVKPKHPHPTRLRRSNDPLCIRLHLSSMRPRLPFPHTTAPFKRDADIE